MSFSSPGGDISERSAGGGRPALAVSLRGRSLLPRASHGFAWPRAPEQSPVLPLRDSYFRGLIQVASPTGLFTFEDPKPPKPSCLELAASPLPGLSHAPQLWPKPWLGSCREVLLGPLRADWVVGVLGREIRQLVRGRQNTAFFAAAL